MICGCLATGLIFAIFVYVTNEKAAAANFKQQHPLISLILIFGSLYFIAHMFQSVLVFFLGILLPFSGKTSPFSVTIENADIEWFIHTFIAVQFFADLILKASSLDTFLRL